MLTPFGFKLKFLAFSVATFTGITSCGWKLVMYFFSFVQHYKNLIRQTHFQINCSCHLLTGECRFYNVLRIFRYLIVQVKMTVSICFHSFYSLLFFFLFRRGKTRVSLPRLLLFRKRYLTVQRLLLLEDLTVKSNT